MGTYAMLSSGFVGFGAGNFSEWPRLQPVMIPITEPLVHFTEYILSVPVYVPHRSQDSGLSTPYVATCIIITHEARLLWQFSRPKSRYV